MMRSVVQIGQWALLFVSFSKNFPTTSNLFLSKFIIVPFLLFILISVKGTNGSNSWNTMVSPRQSFFTNNSDKEVRIEEEVRGNDERKEKEREWVCNGEQDRQTETTLQLYPSIQIYTHTEQWLLAAALSTIIIVIIVIIVIVVIIIVVVLVGYETHGFHEIDVDVIADELSSTVSNHQIHKTVTNRNTNGMTKVTAHGLSMLIPFLKVFWVTASVVIAVVVRVVFSETTFNRHGLSCRCPLNDGFVVSVQIVETVWNGNNK